MSITPAALAAVFASARPMSGDDNRTVYLPDGVEVVRLEPGRYLVSQTEGRGTRDYRTLSVTTVSDDELARTLQALYADTPVTMDDVSVYSSAIWG